MKALLGYLCRRAGEPSTWLGLALIAVAGGLCWLLREQIATAMVGLAGTALAALPDWFLKHEILFKRFVRAALAPNPPVKLPAPSTRRIPMTTSLVTALEAAALEGIKAAAANLPAPTGPAIAAFLKAVETRSLTDSIAAAVAIETAVEAALATVPPGYVPAPPAEPAVQLA